MKPLQKRSATVAQSTSIHLINCDNAQFDSSVSFESETVSEKENNYKYKLI